MKPGSALVAALAALVLAACPSPSKGPAAPSPETKPASAPDAKVPPGDACAGPVLRTVKYGAYVCRTQAGGWAQLVGCERCKLSEGKCSKPDHEMLTPPCEMGEPCGNSTIKGGPCGAYCCDNTLGTVPPDVESTLTLIPAQ
jgi:hypothetical protein